MLISEKTHFLRFADCLGKNMHMLRIAESLIKSMCCSEYTNLHSILYLEENMNMLRIYEYLIMKSMVSFTQNSLTSVKERV